ncbi:hypothetical protein Val02_65680 [Virgisporangium aliadipatigenens]|uniref:PPE family domain-containing protein n=1 Tax=Virgisporangium aliadipatigenens TaxID=741659 RepID=A0A8J3YS75_9ACTN|nr:hypothetical protein [Virgisporangium aliadipatigenens]GIJ49682.1 hypothetical protein Val02_65680 [Virgisporangium aliadipatigenens]
MAEEQGRIREHADGRYDGKSHEELYRQLLAGNPPEVFNTALGWSTAYEITAAIADSFTRTLKQVAAGWHSPAGVEYVTRVGAIGRYARELSVSQNETGFALIVMGNNLRDAQAVAESPEKHDDHDKLLAGAVDGASTGAVAGLPGMITGGVIGAFNGHDQDEKEKKAAHDRMIQLVEGLSNQYLEVRNVQLYPVPEPPIEMPLGSVDQTGGNRFGPGATDPSLLYRTHAPGNEQTSGVDLPGQVSGGPDVGPGGTDPALTDGAVVPVSAGPDTSLAGAGAGLGAGTGGPVAGLGTAGAGTSLSAGQLGTGTPLGGTPAGPGHGVDTRSASGVGRGTGGTRAASAPRRPTSGTRGETGTDRSAMRGPSGTAAARTGTGSAPGNRPAPAQRAGRPTAATGGRGAAPDETAEYDTWLTEDRLVWGDDSDVPPPVLGGSEPPEPREPSQ